MISKCRLCLMLFLLPMVPLWAQENPPAPCPELVSQAGVLDCWLDRVFDLFEQGKPDSAMLLSRHLESYTKKEQEARRLYLNSLIYLNLSKYDSSFEAGKAAARQYVSLGKVTSACKAYNAVGSALREQGKLKEASEYYFKSIDTASKSEADSLNAPVYLNLSVIFLYLDDREKQYEYIQKSYQLAKKHNDLPMIAKASMGLVQMFNNQKQIDSAEFYAQQALESSLEMDNPQLIGYAYLNLAQVAREKGIWEQGDYYFQQIINDERIPAFDRARFLYFYGNFLMKKQAPEEAKIPYEQAYTAAKALKALNLQHTISTVLHTVYEQVNDYPNAYRMALEEIALTDSIYQVEKEERIRDLNTRYETAEKEKALQAKEIEVIKRTNQLNSLVGLAIMLTVIGLVVVIGQRRRMKLIQQLHQQKTTMAEQELRQLRQEQKYLAIQSMVEGEEAERRRLAQELHDGLGGMLSNLKLTLSSPAFPKGTSPEQDPIAIVDKASLELRRIAQNMMPESLARFGLIQALEDPLGDIQQHTDFHIDFQHYDVQRDLPDSMTLPIYRIVQELLHNVHKHAHASNVILQLIQRSGVLHLIVEDDGVGMHWEEAIHKKGQGLKNIQSRLAFLKGQLQVDSQEGKGTTVNIEIPVNA